MTDSSTATTDAVAPIDIEGFKPATLADQPQPQLIWVTVADLVIDRRYQRSITAAGRQHIQRIANAFDWKRYHPILVAPHMGGRYAVVDGQHRAHAAALVGLEQIPAMTVPMTPAEQAGAFHAVNTGTMRLDQCAIFRAALHAGAGWAVLVRDHVEAAGCTVATAMPSAALRRPGVLYHTTLVRRMIANGEGEAVTAGLRAIRQSEGADELWNYSAVALKGWLGALARRAHFLRLDLPAVFDGMDLETLREDAVKAARIEGVPASDIFRGHISRHLHAALDAQRGAA